MALKTGKGVIFALLLLFALLVGFASSESQGGAAGPCQTPSFAVVLTPNVGNSLNSVAVGDLNGDGKPDLVASSFFEDKVSFLLGDGAGNFSVVGSTSTGQRPSAVALGDFNQDGKLDLAVTRDFSTTVSVLLGSGTGSFSAPVNFTVGNNPISLVLADFNNDNKLDIATGNDGSNTISILLGNGDGTFTAAPTITNVRPPSLAVADFNHDNKLDLAAANNVNAKVTVLLGDGTGGFEGGTHFDGGSGLHGIAVGDFNGDTHPDIVVTNFNDCCNPAFVAVLLGNGSGSFSAPTKFSVPFGPFAIAVADFNGDGKMDVATANVQQTSSNIAVLLGDGTGALGAPTTFTTGTTPNFLVARDVNQDSVPDLVATSSPNIAALLNACGGAPTPTPTPTPTPSPTPTPVPTPAPGDVVISQVYSGGGNPGSSFQNNYIELFNRTDSAIDIGGWPIGFTSATGVFNVSIAFVSSRGVSILPHRYLLIQFGPTSTNGAPLNPDLVVSNTQLNLSPSGKVFLALPNSNSLGTTCPLPNSKIIDFVGYGTTASCFEGAGPTNNLSDVTAAIRKFNGCVDNNNNSSDFLINAPNPHNSSSTANLCFNPIDDPDFFVRQHYADFLNRQPDAPGLAFWTNQITSCGTDQACIEIKRINVSAAFFLSIEFQETGYLVERLYKSSYGDATGASTIGNPHQLSVPIVRFEEFLPDAQQIGQGVIIGQPGAEEVLENNKRVFIDQFVQRSRFTTAFPQSMTAAQFVDALNTNAGGVLSQAQRDQLVSDLSTGTKTRAQVLRAVAEDADLTNAEKNRAFVLMQYLGYLRRNPNDAPDSDYSGYDFWLTKLNQFNGNFVNAEMVKAFIISGEYRQRFGP
ncbi:MAG TPA: FG-GAP-like repeat-containing protein [Pyrinomonadaceae bacterium]